jgi:Cu/Ag efflux protein CusF
LKRTLMMLLGLALAGAATAQMKDHDMKGMGGMGMPQPAGAMADGEVRKVDKGAKKITLRHGPIQNLDMPAMTMVYRVKDPAMLDQVKAGDKVKFQAEKIEGALTITKIEPEK